MKLTDRQKTVVQAVFEEILYRADVHPLLGSETIREAHEILSRIKTEDYCTRNGIKFENLTDDDFERMALEEADDFYREGLDIDE